MFLFFFQKLALDGGNLVIPNPSSSFLPGFPACGWDQCVSLDIRIVANTTTATVANYPWIQRIITDIKTASGVDATIGPTIITNFNDLQSYYTYLEQNPNKTQVGLLLCGDQAYTAGDNIQNFCQTPNKYTYYLVLKKLNTMGVIFHAIT